MNEQIPQNCPTCRSNGLTSRVQLYQINFEEAAVMCEDPKCPYPFIAPTPCPLVVPRSVTELCAAPKSSASTSDGDSLASFSSASSWKSQTSTTSTISSSAPTPPPKLSARRTFKPYSPITPKSVMSRVAESLATTPRTLSAQSSPASSVVSLTDREVELFMRNSYAAQISPTVQLTPSPSPDISSATSNLFDDLDSLISGSLLENNPALLKDSDKLVNEFLSEFSADIQQSENVKSISASQPQPRPRTTRRKLEAAKAITKPSDSSSRVTVQLNDTGTTEFVIQLLAKPSPRPSSRKAKPLQSGRKSTARSELNWVAQSVSSKAKTKTMVDKSKVNTIVQKFLMNVSKRPSSV